MNTAMPFPDETERLHARIAALEATVARLTAEVTEDEKRQFDEERADAYELCVDPTGTALTAFLERRMKG